MKPETKFLKFNLMPNKVAKWLIFSFSLLIVLLGIVDMFFLTYCAFNGVDAITGIGDGPFGKGLPLYWITKPIFKLILFITLLVYAVFVALSSKSEKNRKITRILYATIVGELVFITLIENIFGWFGNVFTARPSLGGFVLYHIILALLIATIVLFKLNPDKNSKKHFDGKICYFTAVIILGILLIYNASVSINFKLEGVTNNNYFDIQLAFDWVFTFLLITILVLQNIHVFISDEEEIAEKEEFKRKKDEYNAYIAKLEAERRQAIANAKVNYVTHANNSLKKRSTAFRWCFFLGMFGAHRFYVGKIGTGILYIFTLGFFTFGATFDLLSILFEAFRDKKGYVLRDEDL